MDCKLVNDIFEYKPTDLTSKIDLSGNRMMALLIFLLIIANIFKSFARHHHLKSSDMTFISALGISLIYLIFEYTVSIHAREIGYQRYSLYTLKVLQEAVTLCVFMGFAMYSFGEAPSSRHLVSFGLIMGAVAVAVGGDGDDDKKQSNQSKQSKPSKPSKPS